MRSATLSGRAVWADQLEPGELSVLEPGVPETLEPRPDVLVVGGGILGAATAVACRDAGAGSVLLIEACWLGSGATGGAAGLLVPEAHRGSDPAALVELGRASLAQWRDLEATLAGGVGFLDLDWVGLAPTPLVSWLTRPRRRNGSMPGRSASSCRVLVRPPRGYASGTRAGSIPCGH